MADDFVMPKMADRPDDPLPTGATAHPDGVYFGMSDEEYHSDVALGSSGICDLLISPLTYWSKSHWNPDRPDDGEDDSDAKDLGTYIHDVLLRDGAGKFYAVKPQGMSFATKEGKAWRDAPSRDGAIIITDKQDRAMRNVLRGLTSSGVRDMFTGGQPEVSVFWTINKTRCKIRIDYLRPDCALDLKTYSNAMGKDVETAVAHTVANYRISIKAYWYDLGIRAMLKMQERPEKTLPHWYVFTETGAVANVTVRRFEDHDPQTGQIPAYWDWAKRQVEIATHAYAYHRAKFGMANEWIEPAVMKPFDDTDFGSARWILTEKVD